MQASLKRRPTERGRGPVPPAPSGATSRLQLCLNGCQSPTPRQSRMSAAATSRRVSEKRRLYESQSSPCSRPPAWRPCALPRRRSPAAAPHATRGAERSTQPRRRSIAGDPVLVFGHLAGAHNANREITLYPPGREPEEVHRRQPHPDERQRQVTSSRAPQYVVNTNRSWFVRGPGQQPLDDRSTSRSPPKLTLSSSTASGTTRTRDRVQGPGQPGQGRAGSRCRCRRAPVTTGARSPPAASACGGNFSINQAWRTPGPRTVRVYFPGDRLNTAGRVRADGGRRQSAPGAVLHHPERGRRCSPAERPRRSRACSKQAPHLRGTSGVPSDCTARRAALRAASSRCCRRPPPRPTAPTASPSAERPTSCTRRVCIGKAARQSREACFQGVQDAVTITPSATELDGRRPGDVLGQRRAGQRGPRRHAGVPRP